MVIRDFKMESLNNLGRISFENSKSKGFWDAEKDYDLVVLLIQAEVSEIVEDYRRGHKINEIWFEEANTKNIVFEQNKENTNKPCGIPTELSDVYLWICEYFTYQNVDFNEIHINLNDVDKFLPITCVNYSFTRLLAIISLYLSKSWEDTYLTARYHYLAIVLYYINMIVSNHGINFEYAINLKLEYNKTREFKHGGKIF
jgi:NTP pyrophosphatase (non-canonical NTP hydrolase)